MRSYRSRFYHAFSQLSFLLAVILIAASVGTAQAESSVTHARGLRPAKTSARSTAKKKQASPHAKASSKATASKSQPAFTAADKKTAHAPLPESAIKMGKIHEFRNDETYKAGPNAALQFEKEYWSYGAITRQEKLDKRGHYFVILWSNRGPVKELQAKFEYRQVKSKDVIRTLTIDHARAHGGMKSTFAVVGQAFDEYGAVSSWRFTVWDGGKLLAEQNSFIW